MHRGRRRLPASRTARALRRDPRRSPRPRAGRARAPPACSTTSMRRSVASTSARGSLPRSASLPRVSAIASLALRAAPGWASNTSVRAPHWASTWTMPRPMVPEPATPATRSARETSSMKRTSPNSYGGRGYNRTERTRRRLSKMRPHAACRGCARTPAARGNGVRAALSVQAGHADRAVARGRQHRPLFPQARRGRPAPPRPDAGDREPSRRQRHERPGDHGQDRQARRLHDLAAHHFRLPHAAHAEGGLGPDQRLHLHHRPRRLHLRHRGEGRFAVQDASTI